MRSTNRTSWDSRMFRPGRSPHQALDALAVGIGTRKVSWVLDADIRKFYDTLDHGWLVKLVEHRVAVGASCTYSEMAQGRRAGRGQTGGE